MIKIFEKEDLHQWGDRWNAVDSNNVFVGFDYHQSCCENFGTFISETEDVTTCEQLETTEVDLTDFVFDTDYHKTIDTGNSFVNAYALFRLVNSSGNELFLVLYNHHNGFYSHGFSMLKDSVVIVQDSI